MSAQTKTVKSREQVRDLAKSKSIHDRALARARSYLHEERALLASLVEVDRDRTFELFGKTHLTPYCIKDLGLSEAIAKCFVVIVRKSHHVPELAESVISGEVSLHKARVITASITPENKDEWLKKAKSMSKEKLERAVAEEKSVTTRRTVLNLKFETCDKLKRAQEVLSSKESKFATEEDAIEWALSVALHYHDPLEKAKRARKVKPKTQQPATPETSKVSWDTSHAQTNASRDDSHPSASTSTECTTTKKSSHDHAPKQQTHNPAPRPKVSRDTSHHETQTAPQTPVHHQVTLRDQDQCSWIYEDGTQCQERKWLHHHHIIHRSHGGPDTLDNLATLCSGHHRMIHAH